jgi:hypothetical protein
MNRPGWSNESTLRVSGAKHSPIGRCSADGASDSPRKITARHELELCAITKLALNIANRRVGG